MKHLSAVLLIIASQCLMTSCTGEKKDARYWERQRELIEVSQKIELARYRLSQITPTPHFDPADIAALEASHRSLTNIRTELRSSVADLQESWQDFRREILLSTRGPLIGRSFDNLASASGKSYEDAVVTRIDDLGVGIKHTHGSARIRIEEFTAEEQVFFGLDPEFAATALVEERENIASYERQIDQELKVIRADSRKIAATKKLEQERSASRMDRARSSARLASASVSPLTSSSGRLGETNRRTSTFYYGSGRSTPRYRNVYYYGNYDTTAASWNQQCAPQRWPVQATPCLPAYRVQALDFNTTP